MSERAPQWRVDYHLWATRGLLPTHLVVEAHSEAEAIEEARRADRLFDQLAHRSPRGHFDRASASRLELNREDPNRSS
jgi:hypothetical protein